MIEREQVLRDWSEVLSNHPVPSNLRDHQIDAMALLKQGKHVFLGMEISFSNCFNFSHM